MVGSSRAKRKKPATVARKRGDDAKELKDSVDAAKTKIEDMATKLEGGVKMLQAKDGRAFPKDLANQLGGINVDFDGGKLAGRRFSGFPKDTSEGLFTFVTNVTALNEHKTAVKNLLTKLEKPITEQITAQTSGSHSIQYVVLLGGVSAKDSAGNYTANIAPLVPPLSFTGDAPNMPNDIKANFSGQNVGVPKYKGGAVNEPSAIYVTPGSFDAVCPSDTKSATAQLAIKLGDLILENSRRRKTRRRHRRGHEAGFARASRHAQQGSREGRQRREVVEVVVVRDASAFELTRRLCVYPASKRALQRALRERRLRVNAPRKPRDRASSGKT